MSEKHFQIEVEYNQDMVTQRVDDAIQAILRRAAREIHAKAALLANLAVVKVKSTEFVDGRYQDIPLEDAPDA